MAHPQKGSGPVATRQFGHGLLMPNLHYSYTLINSFYEIAYYLAAGQTPEFSQHYSAIGDTHLEKGFFFPGLCSATE